MLSSLAVVAKVFGAAAGAPTVMLSEGFTERHFFDVALLHMYIAPESPKTASNRSDSRLQLPNLSGGERLTPKDWCRACEKAVGCSASLSADAPSMRQSPKAKAFVCSTVRSLVKEGRLPVDLQRNLAILALITGNPSWDKNNTVERRIDQMLSFLVKMKQLLLNRLCHYGG